MLNQPTLIVAFSYGILFATLLLPQIEESKARYWKKLKFLTLFIIPAIVSTITVNCLTISCPDLGRINSYIICIWCLSVIYIYLFKKLI